jgi:hypothetical protein
MLSWLRCAQTRTHARSPRRYVNEAESGDGMTEHAALIVLQKARCTRQFLMVCLREDNEWLEAQRAGDYERPFKTKEQLAEWVGKLNDITGRTVYRYDYEFRRLWVVGNETGGFVLDGRGRFSRASILDDEQLLNKFRSWLLDNRASLSIDTAQKYLNEVLLVDVSREDLARFGLRKDCVSRTCTHTLMMRAGAQVCRTGKCE